jgi:hypothetical protein
MQGPRNTSDGACGRNDEGYPLTSRAKGTENQRHHHGIEPQSRCVECHPAISAAVSQTNGWFRRLPSTRALDHLGSDQPDQFILGAHPVEYRAAFEVEQMKPGVEQVGLLDQCGDNGQILGKLAGGQHLELRRGDDLTQGQATGGVNEPLLKGADVGKAIEPLVPRHRRQFTLERDAIVDADAVGREQGDRAFLPAHSAQLPEALLVRAQVTFEDFVHLLFQQIR